MTYAAQKTAAANVDLVDAIRRALKKQAGLRSKAIVTDLTDTGARERAVCREIVADSDPEAVVSYVDMVIIVLDLTANLAAVADGTITQADDTLIDTAITTANTGAWAYIISVRG